MLASEKRGRVGLGGAGWSHAVVGLAFEGEDTISNGMVDAGYKEMSKAISGPVIVTV
jgi:hypothetical protein